MRKDGKKRLGSILIVLALMFSMIVILTQPVLAAVDINVSKTEGLTYGETIWVNVSGLTTDNDYEVWIWDTSGWETNISDDIADAYGRVSMEVDVPYRNPLGSYYLTVWDVTGTSTEVANQTIWINNTYLVKMKVNGNEVSYLLHNRTYEYGGDLELTFEMYNGSDFIDEWNLETSLWNPAGVYVANNTISNGKWLPNIVTFGYYEATNLEVNYWLNVTPSSGHVGEWTNISIPVKLNVTTTVSPSDLTYGDEDVTVTIYVKDWDPVDDEDLNVNGYAVKVYAPMTGGAYKMVDSDYTGSNGRAIFNFDTTAGSAGTWYIGTEVSGTYRIDETEKLNIADFIAYASFTVESDERANLKVESPDEIVTGFNTKFNISAYVSDPDDTDNSYYDELKIHVTGLDSWYNNVEYNYDDIITIEDVWFTGLSSNEKYAYYEFNITFNETGTGTIIVTHPENNSVYIEWDNQDLLANITGSVTFSVVSPAAMTIIIEDMVEKVLVDETTSCRWQNTSTIITLNIYGDNSDEHMNASIEITGCGLDISVDEEDAYKDKYPVNWISDGVYEIEISPKTAGTLTITVTNDTESKTVSKDYSVTGLFGTVTTSVGDDLEIPVETEEKITATVTNGQYAEVHVTYFDEDWTFISCLNDSVGDNTAGNGLNGIFEFDITTDDIDNGVGYIVVAASAGANYMYDIVEVVPIHDLEIQFIKPTNATDFSLTVGIEHTYELKVYDADGKLMEDIGTVIGKITDADHDEDDPLQTVTFSEKSGSIWKIQDWEPWYAGTLVITATNDTGVNEHDGNVSLDVGYATISYSPDTATAGIDTEDLEVEVTGVDANGELLPDGTKLYINIEDDWSIEPKDQTEILTLNEDATDTFTITTVGDNATIINATLLAFYNDADSDANKTNGVFTVGYPDFTVTPSEIYINYPTEITIIAKDNEGNPIEGINLTLLPSSGGVLSVQPDPVETDEDGMVTLSVSPQASGKLNVTIARDVKYVGGVLTWTNAVITDTYITVTGIKTMLLELSKTPIYQGETLTVNVKYGATPIADVDVTLGSVTVKTGTDGVAQFTVPDPGVDYAIMKVIAQKTGYISVSEDLTVLKKWEIKISGPGDVNTEASFTITVIAKGTGLAGATATFQDQTQTTDNDGKATFTAPATEGTYTVTATYENMQTGTLSITVKKATTPGFELLTLIVAIGVAFILLRRRRK